MKKIGIVILIFFIIVSSGCVIYKDLKGSLEISNYELEEGETTDFTVYIEYKTFPDNETKDFKIKFITGDYLEVLKDNNRVEEDVIRNVTVSRNQTYTLRAGQLPRGTNQKVVNLGIIIASQDGKQTFSTTSDFILIRG